MVTKKEILIDSFRNEIKAVMDQMVDEIVYDLSESISKQLLEKFEVYLKNIANLDTMVKEFKGSVSIAHSAARELFNNIKSIDK